jgi:hypothetical protein
MTGAAVQATLLKRGCVTIEGGFPQPSHIAYADETRYNVGRYRGLAVVSLRLADADAFRAEARSLLQTSGVHELKWVEVRTARHRFAANKLITWAFNALGAGALRVEVVTWDAEEQHPAPGESGIATLQQMYGLLLGTTLRRYQSAGGLVRVCPDEQDALNWPALEHYLAAQALPIERVVPCHSHHEPMVQLADVLAGLAVYSRSAYDRYEAWKAVAGLDLELLHPEDVPEPPSRSDRERFLVLAELLMECASHHAPIQLAGERGLLTTDAAFALQFASYQPPDAPVSRRDDYF